MILNQVAISSELNDQSSNIGFHNGGDIRATIFNLPAFTDVMAEVYDAIFLPGGHGIIWDLPESEKLAHDVSALYAAGKPVAAVCHGPAGLVRATTPDGEPLVKGSG